MSGEWDFGEPVGGADQDKALDAYRVTPSAELPPVIKPAGRPLLWPAIVITIGAILGNIVLSIAVLGVAAMLHFGITKMPPPAELQAWMADLPTTIGGLMLFILPGQAGFFLGAMAGALVSREPFWPRLGIVRGALPVWSWFLFAAATPVVGLVTSVLLSQFISEPSEQLKLLENMFRSHLGDHLPLLVVLICVLPGICEELLFRGMLQRRLLVRLPVATSIAISTLLFAGAHVDPVHVLGVAPLGVWLGIVAWRTGSIWPAIICHTANNLVSIIGVKYTSPGETIDPTAALPLVALMGISVMAFVGSVALLVVWKSPANDRAHQPDTPAREVGG